MGSPEFWFFLAAKIFVLGLAVYAVTSQIEAYRASGRAIRLARSLEEARRHYCWERMA